MSEIVIRAIIATLIVFGGMAMLGVSFTAIALLILNEKIKIPRWIKRIMELFN